MTRAAARCATCAAITLMTLAATRLLVCSDTFDDAGSDGTDDACSHTSRDADSDADVYKECGITCGTCFGGSKFQSAFLVEDKYPDPDVWSLRDPPPQNTNNLATFTTCCGVLELFAQSGT